jgi:hypothetical protein
LIFLALVLCAVKKANVPANALAFLEAVFIEAQRI